MPSRKPPMEERTEWTLSLRPGTDCSIGFSENEVVNKDGSVSSGRPNEDRYYTCYFEDRISGRGIEFYMVLDGHDGTRAVEFARPHIPHHLLQRDLSGGERQVLEALRSAIVHTEQDFFLRIDGHITRKLTLQMEIEQKAPDADSAMAYRLFPSQIAEIGRLDDLIKGGTTVVAALIFNNKLYAANVGDSRALLCSLGPDGSVVSVDRISVDHNTSNEGELQRLARCGLDPNKLRQDKRLGMQQNTRSIGDYSIKGGYTNVDILRHATSQPGTADPYLHKPIDLAGFHGFLILMSDGLYEAYEAWTRRPDMVDSDVAHLVAGELLKFPDLKMVAQNVVDKVKHLYRDTCKRDRRSGRLDDITLVVKCIVPPHPYQIVRTHSEKFPHSHHPQMAPPQTAPITERHFEFNQPWQDYNYGMPPHGHPPPPSQHQPRPQPHPQQQPRSQEEYWRQQQQAYRQPAPGYAYQQPNTQSRYPPPHVDPRFSQPYPPPPSSQAPYYSSEAYHRSNTMVTGQGMQGSVGSNVPSYHPSPSVPAPGDPRFMQSGPGYYPPSSTSNQAHLPAPQHVRQGSDQNRAEPPPQTTSEQSSYETLQPSMNPAPQPPVMASPPPLPPRPRQPTGVTQTPPETPPGKTQTSPSGSVTQTPPAAANTSAQNEPDTGEDDEMKQMYGWSLTKDQEASPKPPTTVVIAEPQTQTEGVPPSAETDNGAPETLVEQATDEPGNGSPPGEAADVIYYDEPDEDSTQKEDELTVVSTDGHGIIKPYIMFPEKFPADLSWDDIKVAS